ncbi:MAG: hypothetical protein JOY54_03195 [Acidobacteriaceae bacterium]|nr:hypothetical protein [Acidobacteriaceae bacterium]
MTLKLRFAGLFCLLLLGAPGQSAGQADQPDGDFFPRNWVRGYIEGAVAPPHNEPDLNRCASWAGSDGGAHAPCTAFARYVLSGYIELQPMSSGPLKHFFLFAQPQMFLGKNVPQFSYTASAAPMAFATLIGVGVQLPKNFELRLTNYHVDWFGHYNSYLGKADMGKNGPLGLYTTISARWNFGGWGR